MTDYELMQMALDALEGYARNCRCEGSGAPCDAAEALRARLAQPEPALVTPYEFVKQVEGKEDFRGIPVMMSVWPMQENNND